MRFESNLILNIILLLILLYILVKNIYNNYKEKLLVSEIDEVLIEGKEQIIEELQKLQTPGFVLKDVYLPKLESNTFMKIDILFINEKGLIIISSKNYKGRIYGTIDGYNWSLVRPTGGKTNFYNPVRQSLIQMEAIQRFLNLEKFFMKYYVILGEEISLANSLIGEVDIYREVIAVEKLKQKIMEMYSNKPDKFSVSEMSSIIDKIKRVNGNANLEIIPIGKQSKNPKLMANK